MKKLIFLASIAICMFLSTSASAQLANGSFEDGTCSPGFTTILAGNTSITGWTVGGHSVDYMCGYWEASDGARNIDMNGDGPGSLSQAITTEAGITYAVSFDMSGNPDGGPLEKLMTVSVDGSSAIQYSYLIGTNTHADMQWMSNTYYFVASGASSSLEFTSDTPGPWGPALDDVNVAAITARICHRDNGKPGFKTLIVGVDAVPAHLAHGDYAGACSTSAP